MCLFLGVYEKNITVIGCTLYIYILERETERDTFGEGTMPGEILLGSDFFLIGFCGEETW